MSQIISACQLESGADPARNLARSIELVEQAAAGGSSLVCLPEYFLFYGAEAEWLRIARDWTPRAIDRLKECAKELRVALAVGSVLVAQHGKSKCTNTSILINAEGQELARYDKIHLFDISLPERIYRESDALEAGKKITIAQLADWKLGFSICFDLRFPQQFQELRRRGCNLILVPAAFTATTGAAHWEPLLRARAIETQCYVVAAAQTGEPAPGKRCYGHSMIIDPWGRILNELDCGEGVISAECCPRVCAEVRESVPVFNLARDISIM